MRDRLAYSPTECCLKGSDDRVNRAEGTQGKRCVLLGETSPFNCQGREWGFLWLLMRRNEGIPGRGISRIKRKSIFKPGDGV